MHGHTSARAWSSAGYWGVSADTRWEEGGGRRAASRKPLYGGAFIRSRSHLPASAVRGSSAAMPLQRVIEPFGPYRLCGRVVVGFQRGSKQLGWPTANLDPDAFESKFDAETEGVYVGWAAIGDPSLPPEARAVHKAVLSMGWNPTYTDVKQRTIVRRIARLPPQDVQWAKSEDGPFQKFNVGFTSNFTHPLRLRCAGGVLVS